MNTTYGGTRIMVVDDEPVVCAGCKKILGEAGYLVTTTTSAREALTVLEREPFDIVITDVKMPELSGIELLKIVKETYPKTTVIVITGYAAIETAVEAMKLGAFDYLPKPFTSDQVLLVVKRAVERRTLLEEALRGKREVSKAQQILENLPIGIIVVNREKRIEDINSSALKVLGRDPGKDGLQGKPCSVLQNDELLTALEFEEGVNKKVHLTGSDRIVNLIAVPLRDPEVWVVMLVDISGSEQQREEVLKLKRALLEKSQEVINRQMRVAQEIAGLLGETTAETKATLLKLIELAKKEEEW